MYLHILSKIIVQKIEEIGKVYHLWKGEHVTCENAHLYRDSS